MELFFFQPDNWSILLSAITKGTFLFFNISKLSIVWASSPLFMSTTTIAISAAEPPLMRSFAKTS